MTEHETVHTTPSLCRSISGGAGPGGESREGGAAVGRRQHASGLESRCCQQRCVGLPKGASRPGFHGTCGKPGNATLGAEWPLAQRRDFVEQWKLRPETRVHTGRERARLVKCVGDIVWRLNAASRLVCELASSAHNTIHSIENCSLFRVLWKRQLLLFSEICHSPDFTSVLEFCCRSSGNWQNIPVSSAGPETDHPTFEQVSW